MLEYGSMAPDQLSETDSFLSTLADPAASVLFRRKLFEIGGETRSRLIRDPVLLSRSLLIQSYSPFLGDALLRNPECIAWLGEQSSKLDRLKTSEEMAEDLARLSLQTGAAGEGSAAAFKMREMMRIYLRDCSGVATLSEITEELSSLADVILQHLLNLALAEETKLQGSPFARDERGRSVKAEMAIVALGKLGCRELNYASDIDLLFLYIGDGETSGSNDPIRNHDFFGKVAQRIVRMAGARHDCSGGMPIYRTDLRLRPYGRDGDLVWEARRAADYYRDHAQNWERQALIRARLTAGSPQVFDAFWEQVRGVIFRDDVLPGSLAEVRRAKEKIDRRESGRPGGFNVKLGVGGIREIEFIAQALQLEFGGREPWVRSVQTLILLARLAEKGLLSETERTRLSAAYVFLRTVEHRLQMEHGAQTHSLPTTLDRLSLLARRCDYKSDDPAAELESDLQKHTSAVRAIFNSVLGEDGGPRTLRSQSYSMTEPDRELMVSIKSAALSIEKLVSSVKDQRAEPHQAPDLDQITGIVTEAVYKAVNPLRSARALAAWAAAMDSAADSRSSPETSALNLGADLSTCIRKLAAILSSQYLTRIVMTPAALAEIVRRPEAIITSDVESIARELRAYLGPKDAPAANADALRRAHHQMAAAIVLHDMQQAGLPLESASAALRSSNLAQTAQAEAVLDVASTIALAAIPDRFKDVEPTFAILGMGRLGHSGMDHGSDLDLIIVYDEAQEGSRESVLDEFYTSFASNLIRVLSAVTREGFLYSVDMRLRPEGKHGSAAQSLSGLLAYVNSRASAWEHSAYLKAREVAGDPSFGAHAKTALVEAVFEAASRNPSLKEDLYSMRNRLVSEKARGRRQNMKWGAGGMTDVYFVTRYLQLRDRIYLAPEMGTTRLIEYLRDCGSLTSSQSQNLFEGYRFLRMFDHWTRLLMDQPRPEAPSSSTALLDISRAMGVDSIDRLTEELRKRMELIENVFAQIFTQ